VKLDGSWTLWENIVKKRPGLGNPPTFNSHIDRSK
jgi:oleate hydratase